MFADLVRNFEAQNERGGPTSARLFVNGLATHATISFSPSPEIDLDLRGLPPPAPPYVTLGRETTVGNRRLEDAESEEWAFLQLYRILDPRVLLHASLSDSGLGSPAYGQLGVQSGRLTYDLLALLPPRSALRERLARVPQVRDVEYISDGVNLLEFTLADITRTLVLITIDFSETTRPRLR
jgi:hypothetical protein